MHVGLPEAIDPSLLRHLPQGVTVTRIPDDASAASSPFDLDMWVLPYYARQAATARQQIRTVKVVQSLLAGVDAYLPIVPAGVTLCDAQGVHDLPVAEWILTVILASLKYIPFFVRMQATGDWRQRSGAEDLFHESHPDEQRLLPLPLTDELAGKTVLIAGYGSIGRATEALLAPFGVNILRLSRSGGDGIASEDQLDTLLPQADVVVLLVPLTGHTRGWINAPRLARMKHGALLVNAARGPVVDTDALVVALHTRRIHAAVDVTDPEPLPLGHPLWSAPNLLLTPHVAGASPRFADRAMQLVGDQCRRFLAGEPLRNIVANGY